MNPQPLEPVDLGSSYRAARQRMAWSRDPGDVLDQLFIFGPTTIALAE